MSTTKTVRLDVGGRIYRVSRSLLATTYPNSMLARLVSSMWNPNAITAEQDGWNDDEDPIFIDRNGDRFQFVLDYIRDPEFMATHLLSDPLICRELDFFGIPYKQHSEDATLANLQPRFRERVLEAGAWVFEEMGKRCILPRIRDSDKEIFRNLDLKHHCTFRCEIISISDPLALNGTYAARAKELCAIANVLSAEQLSQLWIPEYGMQCCTIEPGHNNITFVVKQTPYVLSQK